MVVQIREFDRKVVSNLITFLQEDNNFVDIPVASSIYDQDSNLIVQTKNLKAQLNDPTCHSEILSIKEAAKLKNNYNLEGLSLYVTLEPCLMCAGAILESKISKLVFGAFRQKTNLFSPIEIVRSENKKIEIVSGVLEAECSEVLTNWFTNHRSLSE